MAKFNSANNVTFGLSMLFGHEDHRIHVLQDDAPHPVRRHLLPARRDELVQALFGKGPARSVKTKRTTKRYSEA